MESALPGCRCLDAWFCLALGLTEHDVRLWELLSFFTDHQQFSPKEWQNSYKNYNSSFNCCVTSLCDIFHISREVPHYVVLSREKSLFETVEIVDQGRRQKVMKWGKHPHTITNLSFSCSARQRRHLLLRPDTVDGVVTVRHKSLWSGSLYCLI